MTVIIINFILQSWADNEFYSLSAFFLYDIFIIKLD